MSHATRFTVRALSLLGFLAMRGLSQAPGSIVISQVYGGGGNSGATLRNDFIELFNRSGVTVDVTGWTVQYAAAAGSNWDRTILAGTIAPGQYYLVQEAAGEAGTVSLPAADASGGLSLSATSGKVALVRSSSNLTGAMPTSADIVDVVGYGAANFSLGRPVGLLDNRTAAVRDRNGCADTRNNSVDFVILSPSPKNRQSPRNPCVAIVPVDTEAPTVSITEPRAGSTVNGSVTINANATDNTGVVGVQFLVDGSPVGSEDTASPYSIVWNSSMSSNGNLLPGGDGVWESAFSDTSDSMDNGFYYLQSVKLRDALPLFVKPERDSSGRYLTDDSLAAHPPQVAQFEVGNFDFTLITVHLTFADGDTAASLRELVPILDYLDWYFDQPGHDPDVIVCGDFNTPSLLSGRTGKAGLTLDSVFNNDSRFQTGERRFVVTVHQPTSRSSAASGGGPVNNYDHCVLSADTMEEFIQARRVDTTILTSQPEDPEDRLTSDHFPIVSFFRTGAGVILDNRPTIRRPLQ